jgi:hypothetical protein
VTEDVGRRNEASGADIRRVQVSEVMETELGPEKDDHPPAQSNGSSKDNEPIRGREYIRTFFANISIPWCTPDLPQGSYQNDLRFQSAVDAPATGTVGHSGTRKTATSNTTAAINRALRLRFMRLVRDFACGMCSAGLYSSPGGEREWSYNLAVLPSDQALTHDDARGIQA